MTSKLTITRERMQEIAEDGFLKHGESKELARMALAAMDSEPVIADCDPDVFEKGVSVCLISIPKETAEVICKNITAATGCKVDWHYFGGRVHIKALPPSPQTAPDEMLCDFYEVNSWSDLVRELVKHVEQLQDSAKRNVKPWEDTFPETLLPAYIERVKQADDACRAAMLQGAENAESRCGIQTAPALDSFKKNSESRCGNSPVIPDGYVMVPKEPTQAMCAAFNDSDYGRKSLRERYVAMLAAAAHDTPALNSVQSVATVPGKWVPVSERMPEDRTQVILWDAEIGEVTSGHYSHKTHTFYHCGDAIQNEITHWMPLPAAPQEVKGES
ncbi:TPA: DUF551 domain-containing protein [Raoultella ornithinolytica]